MIQKSSVIDYSGRKEVGQPQAQPDQSNPPVGVYSNVAHEDVVHSIIGERRRNKQPQYKVRWQGYDSTADTWEPLEHLTNCDRELERWRQRKAQAYNRKGFLVESYPTVVLKGKRKELSISKNF